mmetsp:Transcript_524/g.460  ORF Transcript_524/g.460 Transcript_524/m.460 type:complete len:154 (-) Transcript_524:237-698(-)
MLNSMLGRKESKKSKQNDSAGGNRRRGKNIDDEDMGGGEEEEDNIGGFFAGQPQLIQGTMKIYQIEALNWLIHLHRNNICGILADEMGLGKTLETISLLAFLHQIQIEQQKNTGTTLSNEKKMKHIIIVPKTTLGNWVNEFKKFCPTLKITLF